MDITKKFIYFFGFVFIFFCLCPYIRLLGFNTTTQPNALVFSLIPLFLIKLKSLPREIYLYFIVFLFATIVLFTSSMTFLEVRDWANYLSLILITVASYKLLCYIKGLNYKFFYSIIVLWFLTGFIQTYIYGKFLSFLFSKVRGTLVDGRGVTSLSTEPTYYGLIMSLFFIIYLINGWHKRSKLLGLIIIFQIIFFSKSTTSIGLLFISICGYSLIQLLKLNVKRTITFVLGFLGVFLLLSQTKEYYEETRVYEIVELVAEKPELILAADYSVAERINHMVFPVVGLVENYFLPHGYGQFDEYLTEKKESGEYQIFFSHQFFKAALRILSGHGKAFFELGFVGLFISIGILMSFWFGLRLPEFLFAFIFFYLLLFAALPFMTATVPFILGNILYIRKQKLSKT